MSSRLIFMVEMYRKIIEERNVDGIALSTLTRLGKKIYEDEFPNSTEEPWETFKKTLNGVIFTDENIFTSTSKKGAAFVFSKSACRKVGGVKIPVTFLQETSKGMQMHIMLKATKDSVSHETAKATQFADEFWIPNSILSYSENGNVVVPVWFYNMNRVVGSSFWYMMSEKELQNILNAEKKSQKSIDKSFVI